MDKIALKLQEKLVQTCIDFVNEHKDDEQVKEIQMVEFTVDNLQEAVKCGAWDDSYCGLHGVRNIDVGAFGINECYLIDENY